MVHKTPAKKCREHPVDTFTNLERYRNLRQLTRHYQCVLHNFLKILSPNMMNQTVSNKLVLNRHLHHTFSTTPTEKGQTTIELVRFLNTHRHTFSGVC